MLYDRESLDEIKRNFGEVPHIHNRLMGRLMGMLPCFQNERAKEYLCQGVGRRLNILARCIDNIFGIFPIDRNTHLKREELSDLGINLHAFFVNVAGMLDNLAWAVVHENGLLDRPKGGRLQRLDVSLFNEKAQRYLPSSFREYLKSERTSRWYSEYAKNYRDALAHRIPLYVPPAVLSETEREQYLALEAKMQALDLAEGSNQAIYDELLNTQRSLGQPSPFFTHSFEDGCQPVLLHAQIITDYVTLEEIVDKFCEVYEKGCL